MATASKITVDIDVTIPQDTVDRCLAILSMFLTDNPSMTLEVEDIAYADKRVRNAKMACTARSIKNG